MTDRVAKLRRQTLETKPWLSAERAVLMTEFYRKAPAASVPIVRALAFRHLLECKTIHIGDGELIVGERGPAPKGTPTAVIAKLNAAIVESLADPGVRQKLADLGQEIPPREQQTLEALRAHHKAEIEKWWPIVKQAGIKVE